MTTEKLLGGGIEPALAPSDAALFRDPLCMVDVIHAHHPAGLVPGARLIAVEDLGPFSVMAEVIPALVRLLASWRIMFHGR